MTKLLSLLKVSFFILLLAASPSSSALDLPDDKDFVYELLDYTQAPVYEQIQKHPDHFAYLDSIDILRILYRSEGLQITGLMAAPKQVGTYPVVVFNRGGNRDFGSLKISSGTHILGPIAARGYVVLASNYRGNGGSQGAEEFGGADVADVVNLAKTCAVFEKADNSKLALFGVSRGGMMNYLVLRKMKEYELNVRCAIMIGGVTDLEKTIEHHTEIGQVCEEIVPNFSTDKAGCLLERSAIYWTQEFPKQCPLLILHSYDDASVSYEQIPPFLDSLDAHQIPYKHVAYKKDNHGVAEHQEDVRERVNLWLNLYLQRENSEFPKGEREVVK